MPFTDVRVEACIYKSTMAMSLILFEKTFVKRPVSPYLNTDSLADIDFGRTVKSMTTSPWIFEMLWESVLEVGVENVVKLEISSDTYTVKYNLKTNDSIHFHESKIL